jgi:hypothetical protein
MHKRKLVTSQLVIPFVMLAGHDDANLSNRKHALLKQFVMVTITAVARDVNKSNKTNNRRKALNNTASQHVLPCCWCKPSLGKPALARKHE